MVRYTVRGDSRAAGAAVLKLGHHFQGEAPVGIDVYTAISCLYVCQVPMIPDGGGPLYARLGFKSLAESASFLSEALQQPLPVVQATCKKQMRNGTAWPVRRTGSITEDGKTEAEKALQKMLTEATRDALRTQCHALTERLRQRYIEAMAVAQVSDSALSTVLQIIFREKKANDATRSTLARGQQGMAYASPPSKASPFPCPTYMYSFMPILTPSSLTVGHQWAY